MLKRIRVILVVLAISTLACSLSLPIAAPTAIQSPKEPIPTSGSGSSVSPTAAPTAIQPPQEPVTDSGSGPSTPPAVRIVAINANSNISLAIDDQGRVWQWGNYKLGPNNSPCKGGEACLPTPALVPNLSDVVAVSAGYTHRMALKSDGSLWGWGQNENHQLGVGSQNRDFHEEPVAVPGLTEVVAVSAGDDATLALKKDGTVWAWGTDACGQLGSGMNSYTPGYPLYLDSPNQVVNLNDVVAVDAGWHHSIALRSDGSVWTWGFNQFGELGLGSADTEQHPVPEQVPGLADVTMVSAGFSNSMVQKKDGSVWAWGNNLGGQLDFSKFGDMQPYADPILVEQFADALQFNACSTQLVALKADGTVWLAGFGEIGSLAFFQGGQTSLKDIVAVSCAEDHMLALDKYGVVWAWGNNNVGQLGNGTMEPSPSPQPVIFP
jgi:alpha-tubulin suppressor-like RCC1 family protein